MTFSTSLSPEAINPFRAEISRLRKGNMHQEAFYYDQNLKGLFYEQLERAKRVLMPLPYALDSESSKYSEDEAAHLKYLFIQKYLAWEKNLLDEGATHQERVSRGHTRWEDYLVFFTALLDGIASGSLGVEDVDDLMLVGGLFSNPLTHLIGEPMAAKHFIDNGTFLGIVAFLDQRKNTTLFYPENFLRGVAGLFDYELDLKERSENEGSSAYEDFTSMPMEIKASFSKTFNFR